MRVVVVVEEAGRLVLEGLIVLIGARKRGGGEMAGDCKCQKAGVKGTNLAGGSPPERVREHLLGLKLH